jgi:hypothetical protein
MASTMSTMVSSCESTRRSEGGELSSEGLVRGEHFAHAHEGAHDVEAHVDGAVGVEHGGSHERAVLGEREGRPAQRHPGTWFGHHNL